LVNKMSHGMCHFARQAQKLFVTESVLVCMVYRSLLEECLLLLVVHQSFWPECLTMMCKNSFSQKCNALCLARVSCKGFLHKWFAEVYQKRVCRKCLSRLSHRSASGFSHMTEVPHKSVLYFSLLRGSYHSCAGFPNISQQWYSFTNVHEDHS
jgi:hypothetical protein